MIYELEKTATRKTVKMLNVLALVLVTLFVMSLVIPNSVQAFSIAGKVVATDNDKKTLTVTAYNEPNKRGADYAFALDKQATVMRGKELSHFRDIRVGDWVTVNYHQESGGLVVAEDINISTPTASMFSLSGKVVAIDKDARTFTVDPSYYYGPNYSGRMGVGTFSIRDGATVMMGSESRDFRDIKVGDWVTVNYYQVPGGPVVADGIAITYPPAPYLEERAQAFSIPGKVVAIDRDAGTLTLDPRYCYGPNFGGRMGLRTFAVERGTLIKMGNENKDFRSIRVGDWVVLNYHQANNGLVVTDDIAISSQPAIGCMEERG
jgi:hypothetical protein